MKKRERTKNRFYYRPFFTMPLVTFLLIAGCSRVMGSPPYKADVCTIAAHPNVICIEGVIQRYMY
jgi:hypothetical protein